MKIRTHWTPTYKDPRLVSCNALLGRGQQTLVPVVPFVSFVSFVVASKCRKLMMPAPARANKMQDDFCSATRIICGTLYALDKGAPCGRG